MHVHLQYCPSNTVNNPLNSYILGAFSFGYHHLNLVLEDKGFLEEKYKDTPSIETYTHEKCDAHDIGTQSFRSILSYYCEDERNFFETYLRFLKEYENQYPIEEIVTLCSKSRT